MKNLTLPLFLQLKRLIVIPFTFLSISCAYGQQAGELDLTFDPGAGITGNNLSQEDWIRAIAVQQDGKIIVGGHFENFSGIPTGSIARLNSDGTLDTSFGASGVPGAYQIWSTVVQPDGKVLVGGWFTSFNGNPANQIVRLNQDGSRDASFTSGQTSDQAIFALALQTDGKILVGGSFSSSGIGRKGITRLNADGSADPTFIVGTGPDKVVNSIAIQPDGKILIAGRFSNYNNIPVEKIARLNSDGSLDTSFNPGSGPTGGPEGLISIALQPDGKILIGGQFTSYNGVTKYNWARINSDGSLDANFPGDLPSPTPVRKIMLLPDGKFIVGLNSVKRYNSDGSLDNTFLFGGTAGDHVYTFCLQPDGKVLVGGVFESYNNQPRSRITRIMGDGALAASDRTEAEVRVFPNPAANYLYITLGNIDLEHSNGKMELVNSVGQVVMRKAFYYRNEERIELQGLAPGIYVVRIELKDQVIIKQLAIQK